MLVSHLVSQFRVFAKDIQVFLSSGNKEELSCGSLFRCGNQYDECSLGHDDLACILDDHAQGLLTQVFV